MDFLRERSGLLGTNGRQQGRKEKGALMHCNEIV